MKNNILLFKVSIITAGIIMVSFVVFLYFPYFGMWDESRIFEDLDEIEIISRAEQLEETQLFLEKFPDTVIKVLWERGQILYVNEQIIKTEYGDEKRTLDMQIKFDVFGNPSPYIIGCSGNNASVGGFNDILHKLESDWCFDGNSMVTDTDPPDKVLEPVLQECVEKFDEIYQEYLNRDTSCEDPTARVQCEPVGLESFLRNNEEFTELECPLYIKDWAYLTENNDLAWQTIAPHYTFKMEKVNTEKTIPIIVSKYGFNSCDNFTIYIISHDEKREQVYTQSYPNICAIEPYEKKFQRFTFDLTILKESFKLQKGSYVIYLFHEPVSQFHFTENHEDPPDYQEELTKFYFSSHYMHDTISTSERQNNSGISIDRASYPIPEQEVLCEPGPVLVNGTCSPIITEKSIGDDAPFFGIFVYLDNLISWIFGK